MVDPLADTRTINPIESYTTKKFQIKYGHSSTIINGRELSSNFYNTQSEKDFIELQTVDGKIINWEEVENEKLRIFD